MQEVWILSRILTVTLILIQSLLGFFTATLATTFLVLQVTTPMAPFQGLRKITGQ